MRHHSRSRGFRHGCRCLGINVLVAAFTLACTSPAPPPMGLPSEAYRVGPPDQLSLRILPEPAIQEEVIVRPDGMISVELIGDVQAGGRTTSEIAAEVEERISRFKRNANVTISLLNVLSPTVVIFGQVGSPGVIPLTRQTRVAEAIGIQGGTSIFASMGNVRVIRTDGVTTEVLPVDLAAIQSGDLSTNLMLEKGDIIVVPPNIFAKIGFLLTSLLFPFITVSGAAGSIFLYTQGGVGNR